MLPQFACNLNATLSYLPWSRELDWDLHTTIEWEKRVPFHAYIHRAYVAPCTTKQDFSFPEFGVLPTKLQLRILALCSASTLFQVMHVSSGLRNEASKLFWAIPNVSILIKASWLLDGGYAGFTHCELPFLCHVQKVEIEYRPRDNDTISSRDDDGFYARQDIILRFWTSLVQRLPEAKQVVIVQNWLTPSWWRDKEPVTHPLRMLIQACPLGMDVAAIVLEEDSLAGNHTTLLPTDVWQRSLYRPAAGGRWVKFHERSGNTTVLPPSKRFKGPVGEFQKLAHRRETVSYQRYGLWPLMIEALDRHYFDKGRNTPFTCPVPGCTTYITRAGEWTVHAVELHCQGLGSMDCISLLPDKLRVIFKDRLNALSEVDSELDRQFVKLKQAWTSQSKENRREIQRRWMKQLKNDPDWDTGKKAGESRLWTQFWQQMYPTDKYSY
jgi:hypothetical protein